MGEAARQSQRGVSLVSLVVALVIMVVMFALSAVATVATQTTNAEQQVRETARHNVETARAFIVRRLRYAPPELVTLEQPVTSQVANAPPGTVYRRVTFQIAISTDANGDPVWGPVAALEFVPATASTPGQLTYTPDVAFEPPTVIATDISEGFFYFETGDTTAAAGERKLRFRIESSGRLPDGSLFVTGSEIGDHTVALRGVQL